MDQGQHPARPERPPQRGPQDRPIGQPLARPDQRGNHPVFPGGKIDPNANPIRPNVKAEPIAPLHRLKRRDVKDLLRGQVIFGGDRTVISAMHQIGMPITKGVRHLGNHHPQAVRRVMAQPERHRVEHMAQKPRLGQKINPRRCGQAVAGQNLAHPCRAPAFLRRAAMIGIMHRRQIGPVAREQPRPLGAVRRQQHIIDRIAKPVLHSALAPVKGGAWDMVNPSFGHVATASACRSPMAFTTSTALAKPSSWNPFFIHAPQNHVLRAPFIARIVDWAAIAA